MLATKIVQACRFAKEMLGSAMEFSIDTQKRSEKPLRLLIPIELIGMAIRASEPGDGSAEAEAATAAILAAQHTPDIWD